MTQTLLAAATPFPVPPDGGHVERLAREWATVVAVTESGKETRAALRSAPVRRLEYTAVFANAAEALRFRALWITAAQRLRFIVPLWPRGAKPTAFPSPTTIAGDFSNRFSDASIARDPRALLWQSETQYELVEIVDRTDSLITLAHDVAGSYSVGVAELLPVMNAWLEPPIVDLLSPEVERVPVVFNEEVVGLAGADPSVGIARVSEVVDVTVVAIATGTAWSGRKFATYEARPVDAAGVVLVGLPVLWDVAELGGATDVRITYPDDGSQLHITYQGGTSTYFSITATVAGITSSAVGL